MPRPVFFEVYASDPERAITFYTTVFEWHFERWAPEATWAITTGTGSTGIDGSLVQREEPPPSNGAAPPTCSLTMEVDDLDLMLREIEQAGGSAAGPVQTIAAVGRLAYCRDPEGTLFGLLEPDPSIG
ncbi:glyoxalase [Saccharomonospora sp. CUA-673]|uniref:VOC family protein n=1 Tax=Saccharomonospora sp. CUA-673 TaxID=1904969 RepID=UPI00095D166D|nr:VOC family protein [Saccharomonospora sp. CUA-673]OLT43984.1 glyoxalase [Saccharomonospora sp. CUA-673]